MKKQLLVIQILLLTASLALSGCGHKKSASSADQGSVVISIGSAGTPVSEQGSSQVHEPTLQEIAAAMQDYSHAPGEDAQPVNTVDSNYLLLINKTHPLGSGYWPDDLVTVSKTVAGVGNADTHKMRKAAADAVEEMFAAAAKDGIDIAVRTGFRSYDYQKNLFNSYVQKNGEKEANKFSARPGESEHQTGLACDLGGKTENFALSYQFGDTKEGKWVAEHAHEYGFIIRFTDGKTVNGVREPGEITGYVFEPWHIRYVGKEAALQIYEQGITLEEFLGVLD